MTILLQSRLKEGNSRVRRSFQRRSSLLMERLHCQPEPELLPVQPNVMKEGDEGLERQFAKS